MHYDEKTDTLLPYQTKVERIKELEEALECIASNSLTRSECVKLAVSLRRKEKKKWAKESPLSHSRLAEALRRVEQTCTRDPAHVDY